MALCPKRWSGNRGRVAADRMRILPIGCRAGGCSRTVRKGILVRMRHLGPQCHPYGVVSAHGRAACGQHLTAHAAVAWRSTAGAGQTPNSRGGSAQGSRAAVRARRDRVGIGSRVQHQPQYHHARAGRQGPRRRGPWRSAALSGVRRSGSAAQQRRKQPIRVSTTSMKPVDQRLPPRQSAPAMQNRTSHLLWHSGLTSRPQPPPKTLPDQPFTQIGP